MISAMETIELLFAAPIPSGHRVRIQWYKEPVHEYGFMTDTVVGHEDLPNEPLVRDLDTGVAYGPIRFFLEHTDEFTLGAVNALRTDPVDEYQEDRVMEGRVLSARVLTAQTGERHQVQTTLVVEPDDPASPYR